MDARTREQKRLEISRHRIKPLKPQRIYFPADGLGECLEVEPAKPIELCIEATNADGELSPWLSDEWWIRTHMLCKDRNVTIVLLPTPGALLDCVVLHQLEMIRRIAPAWRILGYALSRDAQQQPAVERWTNTPYDEIRFCEDEIEKANGKAEFARDLITKSADSSSGGNFRQACIRLMHSMPYRFEPPPAPAMPPDALMPPDAMNRIVGVGVVESP